MHMQAVQHIQKLNPIDRRLKVLNKYVLNAESIFTIICWEEKHGEPAAHRQDMKRQRKAAG